jgi:hypothetical protein
VYIGKRQLFVQKIHERTGKEEEKRRKDAAQT